MCVLFSVISSYLEGGFFFFKGQSTIVDIHVDGFCLLLTLQDLPMKEWYKKTKPARLIAQGRTGIPLQRYEQFLNLQKIMK